MNRNDSFPRLYGAPGSFRPQRPVDDGEMSTDPDDLPLQFDRAGVDPEVDGLSPRPYRYGARPATPDRVEADEGEIRPASVGLRGLAHRFLGERGARPIPEFRKPGNRGVGSGPAGE